MTSNSSSKTNLVGASLARDASRSSARSQVIGGRALGRDLGDVDAKSLFRAEAVAAQQGGRVRGDVLRLSDEWVSWLYWLLLVALVTTLVFCLVTHIHDWAEGPALVRLAGRTDLTATVAGTVLAIEVRAGQYVEPHQLLVRFSAIQEQHELESARSELETQLVAVLRDPSDDLLRKGLARLSAQQQLAEAHVAERGLRAPCAGTVTEIRIRNHQLLNPGDIVLTLVDTHTRPQLVAFLPGYARPQVKVGARLRFEPDRFEFAYQDLVIDGVGDEVLGPAEVRRYLGPELADAVNLTGPSVIVTATIPAHSFVADSKRYLYSHGLPGMARAQLRTRSVLMAFLPELRRFLRPHGD